MSLNSWWLAKLEAFQQGWASSAQLKVITFRSHTVLVKQAFGLKYAEHSNTEHCAPQQSGLYHRTLSVTHPNQTKPKNRGCNVHIIIPNKCLDACSVIRSVKCNGTFGSWLCRPHVLQLSVQRGVPAEAYCECRFVLETKQRLGTEHISVTVPLSCNPLLEVDDNSSRHRLSSSPPLVLFWLVSWKGCWWSSQHGATCCDQCHTEESIMGLLLYLFAFCTFLFVLNLPVSLHQLQLLGAPTHKNSCYHWTCIMKH